MVTVLPATRMAQSNVAATAPSSLAVQENTAASDEMADLGDRSVQATVRPCPPRLDTTTLGAPWPSEPRIRPPVSFRRYSRTRGASADTSTSTWALDSVAFCCPTAEDTTIACTSTIARIPNRPMFMTLPSAGTFRWAKNEAAILPIPEAYNNRHGSGTR